MKSWRSESSWSRSLLGLAMTTAGLLMVGSQMVGAPRSWNGGRQVAAWVNGVPISEVSHARALRQVEAGTGRPLDVSERKAVLDRLIDEEVLVQRAVDLGVLQSDRDVRKAVSRAMLERVVARAGPYRAGEHEVGAYYAANAARLSGPERIAVAVAQFRNAASEATLARARRAAEAISAGMPFDEAARRFADPPVFSVPSAPLPPQALVRYLGPALAAAARDLEVGDVAGPLATQSGHALIAIRAREPARTPPLSEVEEAIRGELAREAGDRALRDFLASQRRRKRIVLAVDAPEGAG